MKVRITGVEARHDIGLQQQYRVETKGPHWWSPWYYVEGVYALDIDDAIRKATDLVVRNQRPRVVKEFEICI